MSKMVYVIQIIFCLAGFVCTTSFGSSALVSLHPGLRSSVASLEALGTLSRSDCVALSVAIGFVAGWVTFRNSSFGWLFQDVLGSSIVCMMQAALRIPNLKLATFLQSIMFLYDIFWVFFSHLIFKKSVMVEVARGAGTGESIPMLLRVPAITDLLGGERVLGFGDIILPGLLISYLLRYDILTKKTTLSGFFLPSVIGYCIGLIGTLIAVSVTQSGQPALLYLIPATLGTTMVLAFKRGEFTLLWQGLPEPHEASD